MCVLIFSTNSSETFHIAKRNERDIIIKECRSAYKVPLLVADCNGTWNFSIHFRKILIYQISWKSVQWERSCCVRKDGRTDRQTDMTKPANLRTCLKGVFALSSNLRKVRTNQVLYSKMKGKTIPLQAWTGPVGSRTLMLPDFKTINTWL